jgi:hypothetical protein
MLPTNIQSKEKARKDKEREEKGRKDTMGHMYKHK